MRSLFASIAIFAMSFGYAQASTHHYRHHVRHHIHHARYHGGHSHGIYQCAGCVVRDTLAGVVSVSARNAERFVGVINDLVNAGFRGSVHCAAAGGHVRHSRHYSGNACDFNGGVRSHNRMGTASMMYGKEAAVIIAKHGFTNGCSFRDCGHVSDGEGGGRRYASRRVHHAHHRHTHYART
jgi:hypothetical protein